MVGFKKINVLMFLRGTVVEMYYSMSCGVGSEIGKWLLKYLYAYGV